MTTDNRTDDPFLTPDGMDRDTKTDMESANRDYLAYRAVKPRHVATLRWLADANERGLFPTYDEMGALIPPAERGPRPDWDVWELWANGLVERADARPTRYWVNADGKRVVQAFDLGETHAEGFKIANAMNATVPIHSGQTTLTDPEREPERIEITTTDD